MALLEVDRLSIRVGDRDVFPVQDVCFSLNAGERLSIIGRSGAGKSVLGAAIAGLLRPPLRIDSGGVIMDGHRLGDEARRSVYYVFQNPGTALSPCLSIGHQVQRAAVRQDRTNSRELAAQALAAVGLEAAAGQFPYQLSGGMRQRVLIAMALVIRPSLLIADEPTTGQDPVTQAEILGCLDRSLAATGAALLFITHDVRAAARMCSRTLVMDRGRLVSASSWQAVGQSSPEGAELVQVIRSLAQ